MNYRQMKKKDYPNITKMIRDAWFYEYTFKEKYIQLYSKAYLYMYLAKSDFCQVCTDENDNCIGFIFGNSKSVNKISALYFNFRLLFIGIRMLFSWIGRRGIKINTITNKVNNKLKKMSGKFDGCLELFIVNNDYQNKGIGSILQDNFIEYLKEKNFHSIYLFTDTYSNYQYYEKKGYKRMAELPVCFNVDQEDENSIYYLYAKTF